MYRYNSYCPKCPFQVTITEVYLTIVFAIQLFLNKKLFQKEKKKKDHWFVQESKKIQTNLFELFHEISCGGNNLALKNNEHHLNSNNILYQLSV